jgi:hypothetical protein
MATYTNPNNEIFANSAIEGLCKILLPVSAFARNFGAMGAQRGDQLLVPLISTLTATTFSGAYNVCGGTKTVATVNLTAHKIVQVGQSDITYHSSSESDLNSFGYQMGMALGAEVLIDILKLVSTSNFTSVAGVSYVDFDTVELRAARLALNKANVADIGRSCLIDADGYDALLAVTNFVQAYMFKDAAVLQEGKIMRALGMDFFETNGLFQSTNSIMAFCAHPDAIAVGMRYLAPQDGNTYSQATPVTDSKTGMVIGLRDHYDNNTGTRYVNLECLYGYTVGLTNNARIIKHLD